MSTFKRVVLGSFASWIQILINILIQLFLIPIYLKYWSLEDYSIWVAVQTIANLLTILDKAHQSFIGYELLKIGKSDLNKFRECLWSAVAVSIQSACFLVFLTFIIIKFSLLSYLLPKDIGTEIIKTSGILLIIFNISWIINANVGGILVKGLISFGYYHRMAWWGIFYSIITNLLPIVSVIIGYGLVEAGWLLGLSTSFVNLFIYWDMIGLLKREQVLKLKINLQIGYHNFFKSVIIATKDLLENLRQQGVRVLLAPLSGSYGLIAFTTMRTGANVVLQGLSTITNPLMPELMRFIYKKEQEKFEASFSMVWIIVVFLMCPGVLILQNFIEPIFKVWTQNKIEFNPSLFGSLSLGVLVYGVTQPATAIVTGNNILGSQIIISIITALTVIMGLFILVPVIGILGAGVSLLLAEITALIMYRLFAKKWLETNGLKWPNKQFNIALTQILIVSISMSFMVYYVEYKGSILIISSIIQSYIAFIYWKSLPAIVTDKIHLFLSKIPFVSNL